MRYKTEKETLNIIKKASTNDLFYEKEVLERNLKTAYLFRFRNNQWSKIPKKNTRKLDFLKKRSRKLKSTLKLIRIELQQRTKEHEVFISLKLNTKGEWQPAEDLTKVWKERQGEIK